MIDRCPRCGMSFEKGKGRYVMSITFIADVDFVLDETASDTEGDTSNLMDEIERSSEEELNDQVYKKNVYIICRKCKEELCADPFNNSNAQRRGDPIQ